MLKLNNSDEYEHLCNVQLSKEKYPIAFKNKVNELVGQGYDESEAEEVVNSMEIELELYYHKDYGLFAVDSEAVSAGTIYSPYSGELCKDADE